MKQRGPGENFTDRQRIKRKAERWAAKFAALPSVERIAVMEAMGVEESQPPLSMHDQGAAERFAERRNAFLAKEAYSRRLTEICGCGHTWADHDDEEDQICNGLDLFGCGCECNGFHVKAQSPTSMVVPGLKERLQVKYYSFPIDMEYQKCVCGHDGGAHESDGCFGVHRVKGKMLDCTCLVFSPMPGLGATKPSPRESAEWSAQ